jgi:molecular chaperone GrpE
MEKIRSEEMAKGKKQDEVKKEVEQELKEQTDTAETINNTEKTEQAEAKETMEDAVSEEAKETDEIKKKNEEIEALNNRLLRLQADYLNYKARTEKEKLTTYGDAVADVICNLLPVIDNLERAIAAEKSETDNFKEGVVMVYNQLMGILGKKGLKEIEALHKPFDHNLHYGVAFEECEEYDDGIIIDVLQKGYTVNDKLIRPAMVRICKK